MNTNLKFSEKGYAVLKSCEGCELKPYLCQSGIPTIGWGSTRYSNGVRVSLKDPAITQSKADELLKYDVRQFEKDVIYLLGPVEVNQGKFDALVDFAYNVGSDIDIDSTPEGLGDSRLLKLVLANSNDPNIEHEFNKWINSKGKPSNGLIKRRKLDVKLYFGR